MTATSFKTVRNDFKALMNDAEQLLREAGTATGARAEELRAKGMEMLDIAMHKAQEVQAVAVKTGKQIASSTDEYVHENPWKAVAISAGVGVLIGMLIARR